MTSIPIMYYALFDFEYEKDKESANRNKDSRVMYWFKKVTPKFQNRKYFMNDPELYGIGMRG